MVGILDKLVIQSVIGSHGNYQLLYFLFLSWGKGHDGAQMFVHSTRSWHNKRESGLYVEV